MDTFLQDIRHGLRFLTQHPASTVVGLLTLGLGIGATTAVFSVVDAVLRGPKEGIGVVQDVRHVGLDRPPTPKFYQPYRGVHSVYADRPPTLWCGPSATRSGSCPS